MPDESEGTAEQQRAKQDAALPPPGKLGNGANKLNPNDHVENTGPQQPSSEWRQFWRYFSKSEWVMVFLTAVIAFTGLVGIALIIRGGADTQKMIQAAQQQACAAGRSAQASRDFVDTAAKIDTKIGLAEGDFAKMATNSEEAIKATQESMWQDQRAWVGVDNWVLEKFEVGLPVVVKVRVMNRGKTPAVDVRAGGTGGRIVSNDHTPAQVADILKEEFDKITLLPMAPISPQNGAEFIETQPMVLDTPRFNAVSSGISTWYMVGKVTYKDVFHRDQWVTYCLKMVFVDSKPSLTYCETDNDMSH